MRDFLPHMMCRNCVCSWHSQRSPNQASVGYSARLRPLLITKLTFLPKYENELNREQKCCLCPHHDSDSSGENSIHQWNVWKSNRMFDDECKSRWIAPMPHHLQLNKFQRRSMFELFPRSIPTLSFYPMANWNSCFFSRFKQIHFQILIW